MSCNEQLFKEGFVMKKMEGQCKRCNAIHIYLYYQARQA